MAWRLAKSLNVYRGQIDGAWPARNRASDGTIGDEAHRASDSDHNPRLITGLGATPVVTAADITHDPAHGCNFGAIAEALRASRDRRIKYVIYHERMFSSYHTSRHPAWSWRPYAGDNPHTRHGHLSVLANHLADDGAPWQIGDLPMPLMDDSDFRALAWRVEGLLTQRDSVDNHAGAVEANELARTLTRIEARLDVIEAANAAALAAALKEPSVLAALAAILPAAPAAEDVAEAVVRRAHNGPQA